MRANLLLLVTIAACAGVFGADEPLAPTVDGPWTQIAGNPDLGEITSPRQQPVDFAIWQAADGTWQLWSCIRHTECAGHTRLFYRWESAALTDPDWQPMGIAMKADTALGEDEGGLQAPHVVKVDDQYHMFYGDWNNICHAVSRDGKDFTRVIQPSGTTGMFTEGRSVNTRDIMMLDADGLWHGYYTAYPTRQGAVFCRTTRDFSTWSESTVVAFGGLAGTGGGSAECPHVVYRHGRYYLFRTQRYGPQNITSVYRSDTPLMFGINQDRRFFLTRLPVAAPEIIHHDGQDYIAALNLGLDGIRLARLDWKPIPGIGEPILRFDDGAARQTWKMESGNLASIFTQSTRSDFAPPQGYFIGTAEIDGRRFDDNRTGIIVSPDFEITDDTCVAYVSGGSDAKRLYVALIDSVSGEEVVRFGSRQDDNRFYPQRILTSNARSRPVRLRIVDQARNPWGHINFGGLFAESDDSR